jgi:ATP-dependent RNA helicase DDX5/DBP2
MSRVRCLACCVCCVCVCVCWPCSFSLSCVCLCDDRQFEKDFYIEHPDVSKRTEQDAEAWRASKGIVVRGTDIPKPVFTFEEASMPEYVLNEVLKQGFAQPSPIQSQGWPMALKGRNMVGVSATGTWKNEC